MPLGAVLSLGISCSGKQAFDVRLSRSPPEHDRATWTFRCARPLSHLAQSSVVQRSFREKNGKEKSCRIYEPLGGSRKLEHPAYPEAR